MTTLSKAHSWATHSYSYSNAGIPAFVRLCFSSTLRLQQTLWLIPRQRLLKGFYQHCSRCDGAAHNGQSHSPSWTSCLSDGDNEKGIGPTEACDLSRSGWRELARQAY